MKDIIAKVIEGTDLTESESKDAMRMIMSGRATHAQIGSLLTALRLKGESVEEITGFAKVMRQFAERLNPGVEVVDTCGTGGDEKGTFNISTASAFVAAGAGAVVAKHGNRSVSSKCGSADVLEKLGVKVDLEPHYAEKCLREIGIAFLFAPKFHTAMKHVAGPRKEVGIRTVFNILGPLTNPAGAAAQVLGIYDASLTDSMAKVLHGLGSKRAFVVSGYDGLDEITITGKTKVTELSAGHIHTYDFHPGEVGIKEGSLEQILGGSAEENVEIIIDLLNGEKNPARDIVVLNTAFTLLAGNKVCSLLEGIDLAEKSIDTGKAMNKLNELIRCSGSCAA